MTQRFDVCVAFVLEHETEYNRDGSVKVENDPHDPGGTTKYGIDQRAHPNVDVAKLTREQAVEIYHDDEWTKCCCQNMKPGFDLAVFDSAVNLGMSRAIRLLQTSLGSCQLPLQKIEVDGFIGPKTIAAANAASLDALWSYIDFRETYYYSLPAALKDNFIHGWLNRLGDLRKAVG